ncbi:hypothetical protein CXR04_00075 [Streptomyces sp. CMB-StM0423]|nr:hypothetical protein CXR04_00075 [Streptomyces sp. CMB-StM0423]
MALQFFATTPRQRFLIGATPLLGFASIALSAVVRGDPVETALKLFTAGALGAAVARVVFTPYVRRQVARRRSGLPFEQLSGPKAAFFLVVLTAATLGVAATLSVLE